MFDHKNYLYYALLNPNVRGSVSFTSFQDNDGNSYRAINGYDTNKVPKTWNISFSESERIYKVGKNKKITVLINGNPEEWLLSKYMEQCSLCEGSPNLRGPALYKKIDEEKDAKVLIDAKRIRKQANDAAFSLETSPKELAEMAQLYGEFRDDKQIQFSVVIQHADADPRTFLEYYNSVDRQAKALLKKAIAIGEVLEKGKLITWNKEVLGADEDTAVQRLVRDADVFKALETAVKKKK